MILKAADFGAEPVSAPTSDNDEIVRLTGLLALLEGRIRRAFKGFVSRLRSPAAAKRVADLLERGDIEGALGLVDAEAQGVGAAISRAFYAAGEAEARTASMGLGASVGIGFDPGNARAADLMAQNTLSAVREITTAQRQAIRAALVEALQTGASPKAAAKVFQSAIGLTERQVGQVANYRRLLESQSAEALDRALRDRRFDATVQTAVTSGQPLKTEQVDRMVERYADRMRAYRAETIARTEGVRAVSLGRQEAMAQTMQWAGLTDDQVEKTWRATLDTRTRETHAHLNGQSVAGLGRPFRSLSGAQLRYPGDPSAPIAETANCRCALVYRIKPALALAA